MAAEPFTLVEMLAQAILNRMPVACQVQAESLEASHDVLRLLSEGPAFDGMIERMRAPLARFVIAAMLNRTDETRTADILRAAPGDNHG